MMESVGLLTSIVVSILTIVSLLVQLFFSSAKKSISYIKYRVRRASALDHLVPEEDRTQGFVAYTQQFEFVVGKHAIDKDDIVRPLTIEYDPETHIVNYHLTDPDGIRPHIPSDTLPNRLVIDTNWNAKETLSIGIIIASKAPKSVPVDARFRNGVWAPRLISYVIGERVIGLLETGGRLFLGAGFLMALLTLLVSGNAHLIAEIEVIFVCVAVGFAAGTVIVAGVVLFLLLIDLAYLRIASALKQVPLCATILEQSLPRYLWERLRSKTTRIAPKASSASARHTPHPATSQIETRPDME